MKEADDEQALKYFCEVLGFDICDLTGEEAQKLLDEIESESSKIPPPVEPAVYEAIIKSIGEKFAPLAAQHKAAIDDQSFPWKFSGERFQQRFTINYFDEVCRGVVEIKEKYDPHGLMSITQSDVDYLAKIGVSETDIEKATESRTLALAGFLSLTLPGFSEGHITKDDWMRFVVGFDKSNPLEAASKLLKHEEFQSDYEKDPVRYLSRITQVASQKKLGPKYMFETPAWIASAICFWVKPLGKNPPMCLWSDGAVANIFELESSDEAIRQEISRRRLFRPKTPRFGVQKIDGRLRWVKRA